MSQGINELPLSLLPNKSDALLCPNVFYRCVEDSSDAIMLTDIKGMIRYVNKAWERIYGFSREEAMGNTPRLLRSGRHGKDFYSKMWIQILDPSQGYWKGEVVNRSKDGGEVTMLLTISPFRDEADRIRGYMSIAVDISERKKLEAQVLRQDRLASIGLLASGLAHEIGTPLGVIRGRAEFLQADAPEAHKQSLEVIVNQIDRISKLIYSLLHLARSGHSETTTSVVVKTVLKEVQSLLAQTFRAHGIAFDIKFNGEVTVRAEKDRLEQVFLNLVMNSVQAIEMSKDAGKRGPHRIGISARTTENMWEICITDTGCGISEENMKHLFKPFFTTKDVGVGTGLGLVVINQILQSWGGSIWAESKEQAGAAFKILLPRAE